MKNYLYIYKTSITYWIENPLRKTSEHTIIYKLLNIQITDITDITDFIKPYNFFSSEKGQHFVQFRILNQNSKVAFPSKVIVKKLLKITEIAMSPNNFQTIKDINSKFRYHKLKTGFKIVSKFHVSILNNFREIGRQRTSQF